MLFQLDLNPMKYYTCYTALLLFIVCITTANASFAQQKWTEASAKKWAKSRQWTGDSKLKLNASTNYLEFATQYAANKQYWDKALAFLNDPKLDTLKPGKYMIDGDNVYATITRRTLSAKRSTSRHGNRIAIILICNMWFGASKKKAGVLRQ